MSRIKNYLLNAYICCFIASMSTAVSNSLRDTVGAADGLLYYVFLVSRIVTVAFMGSLILAIWMLPLALIAAVFMNIFKGDKKIISEQKLSQLMLASADGDVHKVEDLISSGCDVNEVTDKGYSSLMYAARNNKFEVVTLLLHHGADAKIKTKKGFNALDFAKKSNCIETIELLQKT